MKIVKWLDDHFEEYILVFLSAFTVVVIFLQVVMRYVFGSSLTWSEEIARYAFIWMIYVGVSYGVKRRKHLGVDALGMLFKEKGQIVVSMIANVSFLIFAAVITVYGFDIVLRVTRASAAMQIPLEWVYLAPVVGLGLSVIRLIQNLNQEWKELKQLSTTETKQQQDESYVVSGQEDAV